MLEAGAGLLPDSVLRWQRDLEGLGRAEDTPPAPDKPWGCQDVLSGLPSAGEMSQLIAQLAFAYRVGKLPIEI